MSFATEIAGKVGVKGEGDFHKVMVVTGKQASKSRDCGPLIMDWMYQRMVLKKRPNVEPAELKTAVGGDELRKLRDWICGVLFQYCDHLVDILT